MARARFFTIEEAARVLRIGRTSAYAGAKRFRTTNGAEGLPVVVVCGSLRVPGAWLEEMAGGPIDLDDLASPAKPVAEPRSDESVKEPLPSRNRRTTSSGTSQRVLPFAG